MRYGPRPNFLGALCPWRLTSPGLFRQEPTLEALQQWLGSCREHDIVAIGVQEAHYVVGKEYPLEPAAVKQAFSGRVPDQAVKGAKIAAESRNKRRMSKYGGALSGMFLGGVMSGPLFPVGMMFGAVAGFMGGTKAAAEMKVRPCPCGKRSPHSRKRADAVCSLAPAFLA